MPRHEYPTPGDARDHDQEQKLDALRTRVQAEAGRIRTAEDWTRSLHAAALLRESFANSLLILAQRPDATLVKGYEDWRRTGRQVIRREHGIEIFSRAPELGFRLLQRLAGDVDQPGFVEAQPKQDGRNMTMVIGPHRRKSDAKADRPDAPAGRAAPPERPERSPQTERGPRTQPVQAQPAEAQPVQAQPVQAKPAQAQAQPVQAQPGAGGARTGAACSGEARTGQARGAPACGAPARSGQAHAAACGPCARPAGPRPARRACRRGVRGPAGREQRAGDQAARPGSLGQLTGRLPNA